MEDEFESIEQMVGLRYPSVEAIEQGIVRFCGGCDSVDIFKHIQADVFLVFIDNRSFQLRAEFGTNEQDNSDYYEITEANERKK